MNNINQSMVDNFKVYLFEEEKSHNTIDKYMRDIRLFLLYLGDKIPDKNTVLEYKKELCEKYAPKSVNSILSSLNTFFAYLNRHDLKVKTLKIQKNIFASKEKELNKAEYERLLAAARSKKCQRLYYLMQTICSTGIRVSELKYITCKAVRDKKAVINCKGKIRQVFLPGELCRILKSYIRQQGIKEGSVFVTRTGKPIDRSNIWSDMKKLCKKAGISPNKVFPHNLRHLFARTYYSVQKDVVRLADILGHSSVNTTRIYTMETGEIHQRQIQKLGLLRC